MRPAQQSSSGAFTVRTLWRRSSVTSALTPTTAFGATFLTQRVASTDAAASADAASTPVAPRPQRQLRLAVVRPDLLDDWIPELNDVDAQTISCMDDATAVWWRCPRCSARYQNTVRSRVARGRAACPHCAGLGSGTKATATIAATAAVAGESGNTFSAATAAAARMYEPFDVTHPTLAARWDTERNGGLHPSQVTAASTRRVWWRPAPGSTSQRSFRRPVFAFVMDSAAPAEQAAATSAMEWRLLSVIRQAARIEEAEKLGSLPVSLFAAAKAGQQQQQDDHDAVQAPQAWSDDAVRPVDMDAAEDAEDASWAATDAAPLLAPEDVAAVMHLWKPRVKKQLAQMHNKNTRSPADSSALRSETSARPVSLAPREMFAHSFSPATVDSNGPAASDTAAVVRATLLNQYADFVQQQQQQQQRSGQTKASPPSVLRLDGASNARNETWVDFFRLTQEEVRPKGYVDPNAGLYFTEAAPDRTADAFTSFAPSSSAARTALPLAPRSAALTTPAPTLESGELVFAYYPRRPSNPPAWEDDITESLPPESEIATSFADTTAGAARSRPHAAAHTATATAGREHARGRAAYTPSFRIEAPFGRLHTDVASTGAAAELVAEYDIDDACDGRDETPVLDAAATLASELRGTGVRDTILTSAGASSPSSSSLVSSAIAALGSAFDTTAGVSKNPSDASDTNSRCYARRAQPSTFSAQDGSRTSAGQPPADTQRKKFRLSMPREGLAGQLAFKSAYTQKQTPAKAADAPAATVPSTLQFNAPETPRKVARPRRLRKVGVETAAPDAKSE